MKKIRNFFKNLGITFYCLLTFIVSSLLILTAGLLLFLGTELVNYLFVKGNGNDLFLYIIVLCGMALLLNLGGAIAKPRQFIVWWQIKNEIERITQKRVSPYLLPLATAGFLLLIYGTFNQTIFFFSFTILVISVIKILYDAKIKSEWRDDHKMRRQLSN